MDTQNTQEDKYYVAHEGIVRGPFDLGLIEAMVMSDQFPSNILVCKNGENEWKPLPTLTKHTSNEPSKLSPNVSSNKASGRFNQVYLAAKQGNAEAQGELGVMYVTGNGAEKNPTEGAKWVLKAAEQGFTKAQCCLGIMYRKGEGVEKNLTEAIKWFRKAAEQGDETARKILDKMSSPNQQSNSTSEKDLVEALVLTQSVMCTDGCKTSEIPGGFGEFGYDKTNPIPTCFVTGSVQYLNNLRTLNGEKIRHTRAGSINVSNINKPIDIYHISNTSGQQLAILYFSMYQKKNSTKAPRGFKLIHQNKPALKSEKKHAKNAGAHRIDGLKIFLVIFFLYATIITGKLIFYPDNKKSESRNSFKNEGAFNDTYSSHVEKNDNYVKGMNGQTYRIPKSSYEQFLVRKNALDKKQKSITEEEAELDSLTKQIERNRAYLDNTNQYEVDAFNAKVNRFNFLNQQLKIEIQYFNRDVDSYNAELQRVGTLIR